MHTPLPEHEISSKGSGVATKIESSEEVFEVRNGISRLLSQSQNYRPQAFGSFGGQTGTGAALLAAMLVVVLAWLKLFTPKALARTRVRAAKRIAFFI
jgi:hypothetical protein